MSSITRRSLVGTTAALAGTAALSSLAFADEADPTLGGLLPAAWDYEADIVVCGLGVAGIRAAVEASDQGLTCIVLEKQDEGTAGGDSCCNFGGIFHSVHVKDQNLLNTLGHRSEQWCQYVEDQSTELIYWLEEGGIEWQQDTGGSSTREESTYSAVGMGPGFYAACKNNLAKSSAEVMYETPATGIVRNPLTGEVLGVYAQKDGAQIAVKAKRGVILATGGYAANQELLEDYHVPGVKMYPLGGPFNTGDGLLFGNAAGVAITDIARSVEYAPLVSIAASEANGGQGVFICWPENFDAGSRIFVNGEGKRFMDEDTVVTHWKDDTLPFLSFDYVKASAAADLQAGYVNLPMYLVVDQACFDAGSLGNAKASWSWTRLQDYNGYVWSDDNQSELEAGWIVRGDTIEELAEAIGVPADALAETVATYNAGAEAGEDAFGRSATSLAPMGDGPFYAIELGVGIIYTIGGLKSDDDQQAIDNFGQKIDRLYIAGNVGLAAMYPLGLDGAAAQGRLAASNIAQLAAWDE